MPKKYSVGICRLLRESISTKRTIYPDYEELLRKMVSKKLISKKEESIFNNIILNEKIQEIFFIELAKRNGCRISVKEESKRIEYYKLPLTERIKIAKGIAKGVEHTQEEEEEHE